MLNCMLIAAKGKAGDKFSVFILILITQFLIQFGIANILAWARCVGVCMKETSLAFFFTAESTDLYVSRYKMLFFKWVEKRLHWKNPKAFYVFNFSKSISTNFAKIVCEIWYCDPEAFNGPLWRPFDSY